MKKTKLSMAVSWIIEVVEMFFGCFWVIGAGGAILVCIFERELFDIYMSIIMVITEIVFLLVGVLLIVRSRQRRRRRLEMKRRDAEMDSEKVIIKMHKAANTMDDMFQKKISFVSQVHIVQGQDLKNMQTNTAQDSQGKIITCTCPHCNGINHIETGKMAACEYCGSVLKGS